MKSNAIVVLALILLLSACSRGGAPSSGSSSGSTSPVVQKCAEQATEAFANCVREGLSRGEPEHKVDTYCSQTSRAVLKLCIEINRKK